MLLFLSQIATVNKKFVFWSIARPVTTNPNLKVKCVFISAGGNNSPTLFSSRVKAFETEANP